MLAPLDRRLCAALAGAAAFALVATSADAAVASGTYHPIVASAGAWAAPLAPAFAALTTASGTRGVDYGGITSQHEPLVIVLDRTSKRVVRIANEGTASCASGQHYLLSDDLPANLAISAAGSFGGTHPDAQPLGPGLTGQVVETISGKVNGKKITGSMKVHVDVVSDADSKVQDTCDLSTTFSLVSAARKEFVGATSQSAPVLVELTSTRRKVNHFHIGWHGACTPSGGVQYGEYLLNFTIAGGRFGDTWTQRYMEPTGEYEVQTYTLAGSIKGTTARGTFRTTITFFEPSGAEAGSCQSGAVTWRATSG